MLHGSGVSYIFFHEPGTKQSIFSRLPIKASGPLLLYQVQDAKREAALANVPETLLSHQRSCLHVNRCRAQELHALFIPSVNRSSPHFGV